jgi:hypothetical protein
MPSSSKLQVSSLASARGATLAADCGDTYRSNLLCGGGGGGSSEAEGLRFRSIR